MLDYIDLGQAAIALANYLIKAGRNVPKRRLPLDFAQPQRRQALNSKAWLTRPSPLEMKRDTEGGVRIVNVGVHA